MDRFSGVAIGGADRAIHPDDARDDLRHDVRTRNRRAAGLYRGAGLALDPTFLPMYVASRPKTARGPDRTRKGAFEAARSKVPADSATIAAAKAEIQRLQTQLNDRDLKAPVRARVLYKVAEPGEDQ
jgi:hypothetical protein